MRCGQQEAQRDTLAMTVLNNSATQAALGQLKKNDTSLSKQLKKVASGMKIVSAGDGAAEYAISEKMRVRIRALNQDHDNVSKGEDMLSLAEGGIQNQINILRTVKEKAIDAANDTNTDADRVTIQKEINQSWQQMQSIAVDTDYNKRRVLFEGNTITETIKSWEVHDTATLAPESEMNGLLTYEQHEPSLLDSLDGQKGPFDTFHEWSEKDATLPALGLATSTALSGYVPGTPNTFTIDLSPTYSSVNDLDNVGFAAPQYNSYRGTSYVLTQDPSRQYDDAYLNKIDISGCNTLDDVAQQIASHSNNSYVTAKASGTVITFTTRSDGTSSNSETAAGLDIAGVTREEGGTPAQPAQPGSPAEPASPAAAATGVFGGAKLTGGVDEYTSGTPGWADLPYEHIDGHNATGSWNISGVAKDSGIKITEDSRSMYLRFLDDASGFSYDSATGTYTVGKQASNTSTSLQGNSFGIRLTVNQGTLSITTTNASYSATAASRFSVQDGFAAGAANAARAATPPPPRSASYARPSRDLYSGNGAQSGYHHESTNRDRCCPRELYHRP